MRLSQGLWFAPRRLLLGWGGAGPRGGCGTHLCHLPWIYKQQYGKNREQALSNRMLRMTLFSLDKDELPPKSRSPYGQWQGYSAFPHKEALGPLSYTLCH